ncbi:MAG: PP0621 family protein [Rhodoferax sp.]|nr:PP0621 family protein [Rhodoferax sp.]
MRFLLIFFVILLIAFLWRQARKPKVRDATQKSHPAAKPLAMVRCTHCGMHLLEADAVTGERGLYCSEAHRQVLEP